MLSDYTWFCYIFTAEFLVHHDLMKTLAKKTVRESRLPRKRTPGELGDKILRLLKRGEMQFGEVARAVRVKERDTKRILDLLNRMGLVKEVIRITDFGLRLTELSRGRSESGKGC